MLRFAVIAMMMFVGGMAAADTPVKRLFDQEARALKQMSQVRLASYTTRPEAD